MEPNYQNQAERILKQPPKKLKNPAESTLPQNLKIPITQMELNHHQIQADPTLKQKQTSKKNSNFKKSPPNYETATW